MIEAAHKYIRDHRLFQPGERVAVAVSGGADSVALLRALMELGAELGIVLSVAHFHHGIRGAEADGDQQFVGDLAAHLGLQFHSGSGDAPVYARERKLSLETAARELRYAWFEQLIAAGKIDKVATAHTLDDQAETVLMRLLRGAGSHGVAGIYPVQAEKHVVRPFLAISHSEIEAYLKRCGQRWREDSSNQDVSHTRNRIRHQLLPLLEREFSPGVRHTLADLADVARGEAAYWDNEVASIMPRLVRFGRPSRSGRSMSGDAGGVLSLNVKAFQQLPLALQRQVLHQIAHRLSVGWEFKHLQQLSDLVQEGASSKRLTLPGGYLVVRTFRELQFVSREDQPGTQEYQYQLPVPGEVVVPELGTIFSARIVRRDAAADPNHAAKHLLDRALLGPELRIRNWRAGDRFLPARSRSPKKIKELLQPDRLGSRPSAEERALWPVVESANQIVWLRGFSPPDGLTANREDGVLIEERPMHGEGVK